MVSGGQAWPCHLADLRPIAELRKSIRLQFTGCGFAEHANLCPARFGAARPSRRLLDRHALPEALEGAGAERAEPAEVESETRVSSWLERAFTSRNLKAQEDIPEGFAYRWLPVKRART
jgi:hypothetical protein